MRWLVSFRSSLNFFFFFLLLFLVSLKNFTVVDKRF